MKIRKVEDKPMVIHMKKKPKLHLHTKKKAVIKKKATPTSVTVGRKKARSGIKKKMEESGQSIKVRKESLRTMAGVGMRAGAEQIEGGEEIKESIDLLAVTSAPALGAVSQGPVYIAGNGKKTEENEKAGKRRKQSMRQILFMCGKTQ